MWQRVKVTDNFFFFKKVFFYCFIIKLPLGVVTTEILRSFFFSFYKTLNAEAYNNETAEIVSVSIVKVAFQIN